MSDQSTEPAACKPVREEEIDEALKGSFPASDPPQWTLGVENDCDDPKKEGDSSEKDRA